MPATAITIITQRALCHVSVTAKIVMIKIKKRNHAMRVLFVFESAAERGNRTTYSRGPNDYANL
ncbi:MAG TPA: hypothetical protein VN958_12080 [Chitinophagaceae bacterium]|nr:hypothetical protein [Chitinophagaceae bacterium]